jgi:hypothetical protein
VTGFKSLEQLAEHLKMLHADKDKYAAHLQHKPSFNDNYFNLIANKRLSRDRFYETSFRPKSFRTNLYS